MVLGERIKIGPNCKTSCPPRGNTGSTYIAAAGNIVSKIDPQKVQGDPFDGQPPTSEANCTVVPFRYNEL